MEDPKSQSVQNISKNRSENTVQVFCLVIFQRIYIYIYIYISENIYIYIYIHNNKKKNKKKNNKKKKTNNNILYIYIDICLVLSNMFFPSLPIPMKCNDERTLQTHILWGTRVFVPQTRDCFFQTTSRHLQDVHMT